MVSVVGMEGPWCVGGRSGLGLWGPVLWVTWVGMGREGGESECLRGDALDLGARVGLLLGHDNDDRALGLGCMRSFALRGD